MPKLEGPLLEVLRDRKSKPRHELFATLEKQKQIIATFNKPCSFKACKKLIEDDILEIDGDLELSLILVGHFSFYDRAAVEFALRLIRSPDQNNSGGQFPIS